MTHVAVGRLRGHSTPSDEVLDRLLAICPTFRVHWCPWFDGTWVWIVGNRIATDLYRATGRYRRERLEGERQAEAKAKGIEPSVWEKDTRWAATVCGVELMEDGDYLVARYTHEEFGTDLMFAELADVGNRLRDVTDEDAQRRKLDRLRKEMQMAQTERARNSKMEEYLSQLAAVDPDFVEQMHAISRDAYPYFMQGRRNITQREAAVCSSDPS